MSKITNTVRKSSCKESRTVFWMPPPSSETSGPSYEKVTPKHIRAWLMCSRSARPANRTALEVCNSDQEIREICSKIPLIPFAWWDQKKFSWRTFQRGFDSMISDIFSGPWPKAGIVYHGIAFHRSCAVPTISGKGYGLLPSVCNRDGPSYYVATQKAAFKRAGRQDHWILTALRMKEYSHLKKAWANPRFSEVMMRWPIGWTDLKPLGKVKIQQWLRLHGKS